MISQENGELQQLFTGPLESVTAGAGNFLIMDPGPFIALAVASPAIIAAVGSVWLGARAIRAWSQRRGRLYETMDEVEAEIAELQERVDFHERLLKNPDNRGRLDGD